MKRKSLFKTVLGTSMLCTLAGATTFAAAMGAEPETKEAAPAVAHDAKAIEILEKSIEASGGREFFDSTTSVHTTGTINIPMAGLSGTIEIYAADGGNVFVKVNIPGFGEQLQGLHDGIGWSMEPMGGPKLLEAEMVEDLKKQADIKAALNYKDLYSAITFVGETEFNGNTVNQIDFVSNSNGNESTEYYAVDTGLLAGSIKTATTEMGEMKVTTTVEEYAEYNGVTMPSKSTENLGAMKFHTTTDSAVFNTVDMSVFEYPAPILALIKASKEDATKMDD